MTPVMANGRRYARPCCLACVSAIVFGFFVGTAAGQYTPPGGPRQTAPIQMPPQFDPRQSEQQMEELNRHLEEISRKFLSDAPNAPNIKKTVGAVNDAVTGMAVAIMLGGVIIIVLIGLFVFKRLRPSAYARNRPLDDPRLRALLADMAEKGSVKAEKESVGQHIASDGGSIKESGTRNGVSRECIPKRSLGTSD
jgi:uncharacterized protein YneF (UPF0154 family)